MIPKRQFVPAHTHQRRTIIVACVVFVALCFAITPIRNGIRSLFGFAGTGIVRSTNSAESGSSSFFDNLRSKRTLVAENESLNAQLAEQAARMSEYDLLVRENMDLKALLGRSDKMRFTLATVLSKPPRSAYDTLLIDGGEKVGLTQGQSVYANGTTPIGVIDHTTNTTALVRLFSTSGEHFAGRLEPSHLDVDVLGRGGGNFYVTVPHDVVVDSASVIVSKDIHSHIVARFQKIVSDPRDPFQTLLFSSPVNMSEISFVEVAQ